MQQQRLLTCCINNKCFINIICFIIIARYLMHLHQHQFSHHQQLLMMQFYKCTSFGYKRGICRVCNGCQLSARVTLESRTNYATCATARDSCSMVTLESATVVTSATETLNNMSDIGIDNRCNISNRNIEQHE